MSKKHIIGDDVFIVRHEADDVLPGERPLQWQRYDAFNSIEEAVSGAAECLAERFRDRGDHCGSVQIVGYPSMTQCDIRDIQDILIKFWNSEYHDPQQVMARAKPAKLEQP